MKDLNMVFAGFGGQGVLFAGKVAAYAGLLENKEISWLCISDEPIGSPLVTAPNVLVAMNLPSLDKFINAVEPGGTVILDSSLIDKKVERTDINVYYVPSSTLAEENGVSGLANMILIGKLFHEVCMAEGDYGFCKEETLDKAIQKCIPARKADMLEFNRKAVKLGAEQ